MATPKFEEFRTMVLSTGHMTKKDESILTALATRSLNGELCVPGPIVYRYREGFFVYCWLEPSERTESLYQLLDHCREVGLSNDMIAVLVVAGVEGYKFVNFDSDGPRISGWKLFEW